MENIDIWRTARFFLAEGGPVETAEARCAQRIEELSASGDLAGMEVWRDVLRAVDVLRQREALDRRH